MKLSVQWVKALWSEKITSDPWGHFVQRGTIELDATDVFPITHEL